MNIGIDAKWFFKGNPSGKVVVQNLTRELLRIDQKNQYYIFLRHDDKNEFFPYSAPNVHLVYIWAKNNMLSNVFVTPYYARKWKIDVFLYQYFSPFIRFSRSVVLIHDVIFESHPHFFSKKELLYFKRIRLLAKKADRIVTISDSEKERLIQYKYGSQEKIEVIHLGVAEKFSPRIAATAKQDVMNKYNLKGNFVLYVGRLNLRKNIHNLINAFRFVEDKDIKLVLAGGYDWKMFDVKKFIQDNDLEEQVKLLGFVADGDLAPLYAASDIFCFVSYDEGFGLPPLEAMASGVPVVVANKGSLPEICREAGIYVDPDQPESIAEAINKISRDPELSAQLKEMGVRRASAFTWEESARKYLNLFEEVVRGK